MADEEELQVTILPEEEANIAAAEPPVTKKVEEPAPVVPAKDPALTELSAQYEELKGKEAESTRRLQEAEQRRAAAERDAEASKKHATSSQYDTITTAINSSQQEAESAKRDLRNAKTAGDIDAEIEASDRLSIARSTLTRLDEAKQDLEARAKAPPRRQQEPPRQHDPVEAFAQNLSAPSAAWVRAHPDFAKTERGLLQLTAADAVAKAEYLAPDSAAYFARVEQYLGIGAPVEKAPIEAAQVTPAKHKSAAPPVAPGAQGGNSGGVPSVSLTKREAESATDGTLVWNWDDPSGEKKYKKGDPIGVKEFARLKLRGMKEGRYDRTYTDS